jgi:hypothetical protein
MQLTTEIDVFVNNRLINFLKDLERRDLIAEQLYMPVPWQEMSGDRMEFSVGALSAVAGVVRERQRIPVVDRAQSGTIYRRYLQYGQAFEISKRMRKFSHGPSVDTQVSSTAKGVSDGWDHDLTSDIFSQAENATYAHRSGFTVDNTCLDGRAPASADHRVTGTGAQPYSNLIGGAGGLPLSTDNYITGWQLPNQSAVDEYGTSIKARYRTCVIAQNADMERKARQIHGSPKEPEVFENGLNVIADGQNKLVVLTHGDFDENLDFDSTLSYRWMLKSDDDLMRQCNQMSMAQQPEVNVESRDENNLAARFVVDMFACKGIPTWQDKMYSNTTEAP